jgi:type II restriction enzyme
VRIRKICTKKPKFSAYKTNFAFSANPNANVNSLLTISYNPYEPQQYNRWTMRGMLDLSNELKVANEFWDFIGGEGAYQDLLNIFEQTGIELRPEIDAYFARYNRQN